MPERLDITLTDDNPLGRALAAGRLVVTVVERITGDRVGVELVCKRKNGKWQSVPFREATHVFCNVARSWDKIGTYYPQKGLWYSADHADRTRTWSALKVLEVADGRAAMSNHQWIIEPAGECLRCGAELTETEGFFGPTCADIVGAEWASRGDHQTKNRDDRVEGEHPPRRAPEPEPEPQQLGLIEIAPGESLDDLYARLERR